LRICSSTGTRGLRPQPGRRRRPPDQPAIEEAVSDKALEGDGPWAAVPAEWAQRIADHAEVYRSSSPTLRALTGLFRNTVLPTSLPWIFGNVSEAAIRTAIHNPRIARDVIFYRRTLKAIEAVDPEEASRIRDMLGTGHFGMSEISDTYTSLAQFSNSRLRPVAKALAVARRTHGPKQVADAYAKFTDWVFHTANQGVETPFREAIAGAHLRGVFGDRAIGRISAQAVEDAANGLRNTNAQVRMADEVRRAYGQYEAFSPGQRKFIVLYSPFAAWSLNAMKFLAVVLPKDHPVLTAAAGRTEPRHDRLALEARPDRGRLPPRQGSGPSLPDGLDPDSGRGAHSRPALHAVRLLWRPGGIAGRHGPAAVLRRPARTDGPEVDRRSAEAAR
jgi:hypothetical protein